VVTEKNGLAVAHGDQLRRDGAVERPEFQRILRRPRRMELRGNGRRGVDARVKARWHLRIVGGIGRGPFLRGLHGEPGWEGVESLAGPDRAWWAPLDGASVACDHPLQPGVKELLRGVCLGRRGGIQEPWFRKPRQDVEARHGLREGLDAEQRAPRRARRDLSEGTLGKGAQAVDRHPQSPRREEAPFDQLTSGDLSLGPGLENLCPILAGVLGFAQPSLLFC
jgi:hypothetical protein